MKHGFESSTWHSKNAVRKNTLNVRIGKGGLVWLCQFSIECKSSDLQGFPAAEAKLVVTVVYCCLVLSESIMWIKISRTLYVVR